MSYSGSDYNDSNNPSNSRRRSRKNLQPPPPPPPPPPTTATSSQEHDGQMRDNLDMLSYVNDSRASLVGSKFEISPRHLLDSSDRSHPSHSAHPSHPSHPFAEAIDEAMSESSQTKSSRNTKTSLDIDGSFAPSPIASPVASVAQDAGSIDEDSLAVDAVDTSNLSNLSAVEKLKLASSMASQRELKGSKTFVSLLESSIHDLEAVERKEKKARKKDRERLSTSLQSEYSEASFVPSLPSHSSRRSRRSETKEKKESERSLLSSKSRESSGSRESRGHGGHGGHGSSSRHVKRSRKHHKRERERSHRHRSDRGDDRDKRDRRHSDLSDDHSKVSALTSRTQESDWDSHGGSYAVKPHVSGHGGGSGGGGAHGGLAPVPKEARKILACTRGSEPLPRELIVSSVVRQLISRKFEGDEGEGGTCVAIVSGWDDDDGNVENDGKGGRNDTDGSDGTNDAQKKGNGSGTKKETLGGIGKSTIAALVCLRGDVRTRYNRGMAWIHVPTHMTHIRPTKSSKERSGLTGLDFESYCKALHDLCQQIGLQYPLLRLSPFVRSPNEEEVVAHRRMRSHMEEARRSMGRLLEMWMDGTEGGAGGGRSLSSRGSKGRSQRAVGSGARTNILIVLDDVTSDSDVDWFRFPRVEEDEQINDLLITSRFNPSNTSNATMAKTTKTVKAVKVPRLTEKEALKLLLTESDLSSHHALAKNSMAVSLVRKCQRYPLTLKCVGRWLNLKRVTSGGQKGLPEVLEEVYNAVNEVSFRDVGGGDSTAATLDVLYGVLNQAFSPLVKGKPTKVVKLCYAAYVTVFCSLATSSKSPSTTTATAANTSNTSNTAIPANMAGAFFTRILQDSQPMLSQSDPLFQSHGRHAAKLVPEILGSLGIFDITTHSSKAEGTDIQIDHELIRLFGERICYGEDGMDGVGGMGPLVENAQQRWNEAYVKSYSENNGSHLWEDYPPDRIKKYALVMMPTHMTLALLLEDVESLLCSKSFIRGRFWSLGWTEGTRLHVKDAELFWEHSRAGRTKEEESRAKLLAAYEELEAVLMEEVSRDEAGPNGRCTTLEAGRCLHEISLSLSKIGLWKEASKFCDTCQDLVSSNLGATELVAALLYNSSVMHLEANEYQIAEKKVEECMSIRAKTSGTDGIRYLRALCQLGDVLSIMSDYSAAEACFDKSIVTLRQKGEDHSLDLGIALYKQGRNHHRRGMALDEALKCYEQSLEYEKMELGSRHRFIANIYRHMGDLLLQKGSVSQAEHAYKEALDILHDCDSMSLDVKVDTCITEAMLLSIRKASDECIDKLQQARSLVGESSNGRKSKLVNILSLVGSECGAKHDFGGALSYYEQSYDIIKSVFGPTHLDAAKSLINLFNIYCELGEYSKASQCLEGAVHIRKTRLGDCREVADTLSLFGSHLKEIGDFEKAELVLKDSLMIVREMNGDKHISLVRALLGMADLMNNISEFDNAMEYYVECLEVQKMYLGKTHDDIASTLYAMGLTKLSQGLYPRSLVFFTKSVEIRIELHGDYNPLIGDTFSMMGFVEAKLGNLDLAHHRLSDALRVRKIVGDRLKEAETLSNIGNLHRERKEFELAAEHYDDCLSIRVAELGKENEHVADALMALGNVKSDMGLHEEALSSYNEALQIISQINGDEDETTASILERMGSIHFRAGNLESALTYLEKAVSAYRSNGIECESKLVTPLFIIGNIHNILQESDQARYYWTDAVKVIKSVGDSAYSELLKTLSKLIPVNEIL